MKRRFPWPLLAVVLAGCGRPPEAVSPPHPAPAPAASRNPKIPVEVSYPIVEDDEEYNAFSKKRIVEVSLNMKVTEEVLREIALEVKATEKHQYERTFINYYVPNPVPGGKKEIWASSHFNPTLVVEIRGLSVEDEAKLRGLPLKHQGKRIGAWLIDSQYSSRVEVLYEDGELFYTASFYTKGDPYIQEMVELPPGKTRGFKTKQESHDVYEIGEDDNLWLRDDDGLILTAVSLGKP